MHEIAISKPIYKILAHLTGEDRIDIALPLATKDLLRLKIKENEGQIKQFEKRYKMNFDEFKIAWESGNIKLSAETSTTQRNEQFTSTIHLEPTLRRAIAIVFFDNKTGDQNLEWLRKGLTEMLIRSLSQSSSLSVLSSDRMFEIINQLGESAEEVDFDMAAIVAQEADVEAVLTGNISKKGDSLQITVRVHEPNQGKILKEASAEGKGLEAIFSMVDDLSQQIKNTLALSLEKQEHARSLADISTSSLEAWRYYTAGVELFNKLLFNDAIAQFERAVTADSTFVSAYYKLCLLLFRQGERDKGFKYFKKLQALRSTATPKDRFQIDRLEGGIERDLRKIIEASQRWIDQNPGDVDAFFNLGDIYFNYGNYKLAEKNFKASIKRDENFVTSWLMLSDVYLEQGDVKKALETINQFLEKANDPRSKADGYAQMGFIQWKLGNIDNAIDYFQKFVEKRIVPYRAATWVNELYLEKGDSLNAIKSLHKNYDFIRDSLVSQQPILFRDLANFSLWYDVNTDETITIIERMLEQNSNPMVQMWGKFYLALLYLETNRLEKYHRVAEIFTAGFSELLKDIRDVPLAREIWKAFLIFNQHAYRSFDDGIETYYQLIQYCSDHELIIPEMIFRLFLADVYFHHGKQDKAKEQLKIIGAPEEKQWLVIAPFDNTDGFQKRYPPEREIKLSKTYRDRKLELSWQHPADGFNEGYINFKQMYQKYNWSVAYGLIYVKSNERTEAQIRIGTNDSVKLWLNDKEVWRMNIGRDAVFDNDIVTVVFEPGLNKILIKVCNRINEWGFYFRVTGEDGYGFHDIDFVTADQVEM